MTISSLLDGARKQAEPVIRTIADDQLGAPTPCAEYTVKDLVNHLLHVVIEFQELAAKRDADFSTTPDRVEGDWRDLAATEMEKLVAAWAQPGAEDGTSGQMGLPATTVGQMAVLDLTIHAWDLAHATGQDFTPDPDAVAELMTFADQMAPTARQMGVFGEAKPVPADASEFQKLLAVTGRDPV